MSTETELRALLYRAIRELAYVQTMPDHSLCASSNGASIVSEGMALLGGADLSAEELLK